MRRLMVAAELLADGAAITVLPVFVDVVAKADDCIDILALGNLADFDPLRDLVSDDQLEEIDRWMLLRTAELVRQCRAEVVGIAVLMELGFLRGRDALRAVHAPEPHVLAVV